MITQKRSKEGVNEVKYNVYDDYRELDIQEWKKTFIDLLDREKR